MKPLPGDTIFVMKPQVIPTSGLAQTCAAPGGDIYISVSVLRRTRALRARLLGGGVSIYISRVLWLGNVLYLSGKFKSKSDSEKEEVKLVYSKVSPPPPHSATNRAA